MKHIVKLLALLVAVSAFWIGLLETVIPRSYAWLLPVYFVVSLGCYRLLMVGVGLMHFPTCPQEAGLLQQCAQTLPLTTPPELRSTRQTIRQYLQRSSLLMWKYFAGLLKNPNKKGSEVAAADNLEAEPTSDSNKDTLGSISSGSDEMNKKETTEKYKRLTFLGSGSFGEIWLVVNKATKECFAMKCIQRGGTLLYEKYMAREIINQKSLCHPNIIQFVEVVLTSSYLGIVMEYAERGDLDDMIFRKNPDKGLGENVARYFFQQLISGISYLQSMDICHRDLKPGNILLDGSNPPCLKICDFGFSKSGRQHSKPKSAVGTPQYMAPEVRDREYDGKLADLWSCGVILYVMLVGKHPEYGPNVTGETSNVHETNACPFSLPEFLSLDSKDLLARMLVADPGKRLSINDVKKHRWCKKKLKGKQLEATQATEEHPRLSLQSDGEIEKIVEEAKSCPSEDATIDMEEYFEFVDAESEDEAIDIEDVESEDEEDEN